MSTESYSNLCRICLSEDSTVRNILSPSKETITFRDMIMSLTSVLILENDSFPKNICESCIDELQRAFAFRKLCVTSDFALRNTQTEITSDAGLHIKEEPVQDTEFVEIKEDNVIEFDLDNNKKQMSAEVLSSDSSSVGRSSRIGRVYDNKSASSFQGQRVVPPQQAAYKCNLCHRAFEKHRYLVCHLHTHTKYVCTICRASFSQQKLLSNHVRLHSGQKPYCCEICRKTFSLKKFLTHHLCIHHNTPFNKEINPLLL